MKRMIKAILLFDFMAGLLFLSIKGLQDTAVAADSGIVRIEGDKDLEMEEVKKIAITFDDGPHPSYTAQLLDGLKERGIQATFFVTGEHAELHPDIIERMFNEGHLIGNHTYSHIQLTKSNRDKFRDELIKTNEILKEITGEEVQYVRPPYGSWDKSFEKELNMFPVLWTVDPLDWSSRNVGRITEKIVSKTGENDIILMHDLFASSSQAALQIVDALQAKGFCFVTVEQLMEARGVRPEAGVRYRRCPSGENQ